MSWYELKCGMNSIPYCHWKLWVLAKQKVFVSSKETVYQNALPRDLVMEGGGGVKNLYNHTRVITLAQDK